MDILGCTEQRAAHGTTLGKTFGLLRERQHVIVFR